MTDNGSPTDANNASESAYDFPTKLRVHALARVLGLTSKEVLAHLAELGWHTRSAQSSVQRDMAEAVAERVRGESAEDEQGGDKPTPETPPEDAAAPAVAPAVDTPPTPTDVDVPAADVRGAVQADVSSVEPEEAATDEPPSLFSAVQQSIDAPVSTASAGGAGPLFLAPEASEAPSRPGRHRANEGRANATRANEGTTSDDQDSKTDSPRAGNESTDQRVDQKSDNQGSDRPSSNDRSSDKQSSDDQNPDEQGSDEQGSDDQDDSSRDGGRNRRRRRGRRGRGRGRGDQDESSDDSDERDSDGGDTTNRDAKDGDAKDGDTKDSDTNDSDTNDGDATDSDTNEDGPQGGESKDGESKDSESKDGEDQEDSGSGRGKKSRGKRTRNRSGRRGGANAAGESEDQSEDADAADSKDSDSTDGDAKDSDADTGDSDSDDAPSSRRRRHRRRRKGGSDSDDASADDPPNTVVHEREPRSKRARDEVQGISGSTRLEAKRQRRRDGRDAGRRRPPILSESEFLARREAVDRVMVVRERGANVQLNSDHEHARVEDYTQVAVLEDGVLVEHFVTTSTSSSMVGNIYLGRVQNVLPGMEAAFVDIGRGRNGVLYAGEVNWDAAGLGGGSRKIEQALKPGDNVLVQVSKDPVGHKGARLTTQISLAGRYLVYVPGGSSTGISRKLPDVERKRLKQVLSKLVPEDAGVIIRTASEGVSAEDLGADITRLEDKWKSIDEAATKAQSSAGKGGGTAPKALYEEPDLLVRVVRDLFNEDFKKLVVEGDKAWSLVEGYVTEVAPDLMERVEKFTRDHADAPDSFVVHRIDEQLAKALDRKVWLPSGGTLIIEHTEAMTVIDVNTGKFTGSGGNLEETVTRNNLEAAEEIVRQMRLRDLGGMIIVDFIDMVLESNRDLVLRRLTESLARDRTRHQVSEVTSLGLVQMTRKRLGTGLLEAFSTTCTNCGGRGIIVHASPVEVRSDDNRGGTDGSTKRSRRGKKKAETATEQKPAHNPAEHPMFRAMAAHSHEDDDVAGGDGTQMLEADGQPAVSAEDHRDVSASDAGQTDTSRADTGGGDTGQADTGKSDSRKARRGRSGAPKADAPKPEVDKAEADKSAADTVDASKVDDAPAHSADTSAGVSAGAEEISAADAPADPPVRRRRRAVRKVSTPTSTGPGLAITVNGDGAASGEAEPPNPVTTAGPMTTSGGADVEPAVVAVKRRPRRRTAGRPAGPPLDE